MRAPLLDSRFAVDYVVALLADERDDLIELFLRVLSPDQSRIELSLRSIGHDVLRLLAYIRAAQSSNIQRRLHDQFHQFLPATFWFGDAQFPFEISVVVR